MELIVFPNYTFYSADNETHRPDFVLVLSDKIILLEMVGHIDTINRIYDIKRVHGDKPVVFIRYSSVFLLLTPKPQRNKKLSRLLSTCIDMIHRDNIVLYM